MLILLWSILLVQNMATFPVASILAFIHLAVSSNSCRLRSLGALSTTDILSTKCCSNSTEIVLHASDDGAVWNDAVLDHNHNPVLDHEAQMLHVGLFYIPFVDNLNIAANPCIFVNNGFAHHGVCTCTRFITQRFTCVQSTGCFTCNHFSSCHASPLT